MRNGRRTAPIGAAFRGNIGSSPVDESAAWNGPRSALHAPQRRQQLTLRRSEPDRGVDSSAQVVGGREVLVSPGAGPRPAVFSESSRRDTTSSMKDGQSVRRVQLSNEEGPDHAEPPEVTRQELVDAEAEITTPAEESKMMVHNLWILPSDERDRVLAGPPSSIRTCSIPARTLLQSTGASTIMRARMASRPARPAGKRG